MPGKDQPLSAGLRANSNNGDDSAGIARQTGLIQGITGGCTTGETHNPDRDLIRRNHEQGYRQELLNAVMGQLPCQQPKKSPSDARKICPVPAKTHSARGNLATPIGNPGRA